MKLQLALLASLAVIAAPLTAASSALWPSDYQPTPLPSNCSPSNDNPDSNHFCYLGDHPVELGVKFTASKLSKITGVRIYRVDDNTVTGSLWTTDHSGGGTQLTTGQFSPHTGHGWQDLVFSSPVRIAPGTTYIASYFTNTAVYAFQHDFFTSSLAVGPITALKSRYCYSGSSCLPTLTDAEDSNYWVSPLWISSDFAGFFPPVANAGYNTAKAGSAIPVKFSLGGDYGLDILKTGFPKPLSCDSGVPIEGAVIVSTSGLTYDATAGQYVYVWKTDKAWAGQCVQFDLRLIDDNAHTFKVQFK